jgi:hypothetical protein
VYKEEQNGVIDLEKLNPILMEAWAQLTPEERSSYESKERAEMSAFQVRC